VWKSNSIPPVRHEQRAAWDKEAILQRAFSQFRFVIRFVNETFAVWATLFLDCARAVDVKCNKMQKNSIIYERPATWSAGLVRGSIRHPPQSGRTNNVTSDSK